MKDWKERFDEMADVLPSYPDSDDTLLLVKILDEIKISIDSLLKEAREEGKREFVRDVLEHWKKEGMSIEELIMGFEKEWKELSDTPAN